MARRSTPKALGLAEAILATPFAVAAPTPPPAGSKGRLTRVKVPVPPLPPGENAAWSHAPYQAGDCSICHQKNDRRNPGPLVKAGNGLCYSCHEAFAEIMARRFKHPPAVENCTTCHNPHDAQERALLIAEQTAQCYECHRDIKAIAERSKVKHDALATGSKCAGCHNPHAANVERLLAQLPFDLCISCHSRDGISDGRGGTLTNFKKWLEQNQVWHEPVKAKDCSACHKTHGGDLFRLLVAEYPRTFYAPNERRSYALCYGCHNEKVVSEPETTTLTGCRDGSHNLHTSTSRRSAAEPAGLATRCTPRSGTTTSARACRTAPRAGC